MYKRQIPYLISGLTDDDAETASLAKREIEVLGELHLEKEWKGDLADDDCVELCVKTLLEVVDSGAKNMEVVVLKIAEDGTRSETTLPDEALDAMCARIEREREEGKDEGKDEMKD